MSNEVASGKISNVDFSSLKLRAGAWLQLHSIEGAPQKLEVEFAAALHGKSLFVAMAEGTAGNIRLKPGARYLVRGFNGVSDFTFASNVIDVQMKPFVHAHLAYPDTVEAKVVRDAARVEVSLTTTVSFEGLGMSSAAKVKDLSAMGALIESATPLGVSGDRIQLSIPTQFEKEKTNLKISAVIRHADNAGNQQTSGIFKTGVEFMDIAQKDKLILYYLLFTLAGREQ